MFRGRSSRGRVSSCSSCRRCRAADGLPDCVGPTRRTANGHPTGRRRDHRRRGHREPEPSTSDRHRPTATPSFSTPSGSVGRPNRRCRQLIASLKTPHRPSERWPRCGWRGGRSSAGLEVGGDARSLARVGGTCRTGRALRWTGPVRVHLSLCNDREPRLALGSRSRTGQKESACGTPITACVIDLRPP